MGNNTVEILHIEDNLNDAELAIRALCKSHINNKIVHLQNGAEATEFLFETGKFEGRNIEDKQKVIVLDLKMPN